MGEWRVKQSLIRKFRNTTGPQSGIISNLYDKKLKRKKIKTSGSSEDIG